MIDRLALGDALGVNIFAEEISQMIKYADKIAEKKSMSTFTLSNDINTMLHVLNCNALQIHVKQAGLFMQLFMQCKLVPKFSNYVRFSLRSCGLDSSSIH